MFAIALELVLALELALALALDLAFTFNTIHREYNKKPIFATELRKITFMMHGSF